LYLDSDEVVVQVVEMLHWEGKLRCTVSPP
jgi:hypothetical protein